MKHTYKTASSVYKSLGNWVDASTVIITTPRLLKQNSSNTNHFETTESHADSDVDYDVMMLQRSSRSSFYPNAYVFPGGKVDKADCSKRWIDVYHSVNQSFIKHFKRLQIKQTDGCRPPMFQADSNDAILREVAYRICAIRETFEETGVLLARLNADNLESEELSLFADCYKFQNSNDVKMWQKRVHDDAGQFLELCTQLRCVPDVWGLHEWSDWLTPSQMLTTFKKRFDTVFYKAALSTVPEHAREDNKEISHIIVNRNILGACDALKIILGPPQMYELARVVNFSSHLELAKFSAERGLKGMERWLPVLGVTQDMVASALYPGDHWYPAEAVSKGDSSPIQIPLNYEDLLRTTPDQLNHMKFDRNQRKFMLTATIKPRYHHAKPLPVVISMSEDKNMLGKL